MDEQVVNKVISEYAIENANLRVTVAMLEAELAKEKEEKESKE